MLTEDLKAKARWLYGDDDMRKVARALLSDATLSLFLYRGMSFFGRNSVTRPIAFLLHKMNAWLCGCVIGMNARFGKRLIILHSVGITVNSAVVAGDDVTLENGVVIGAEKGRSPKIGDRVFFGSGAKVVGDISIGSDVLVGANAVVVKDVQSSVVVGGVPARVLRYQSQQVNPANT
jgi:serine O-acetyltransferase